MVKIRLTRTGRKNHANYRIVAIDHRKSTQSKALEYLGHYSPHSKQLEVQKDRVKHWMSVGAKPSQTVMRLLVKAGVVKKSEAPKVAKYAKKPGRKAKERNEATN